MGTRGRIYQRIYNERDHPHAYGDKVDLFSASLKKIGSSPRVWGQAPPNTIVLIDERIIPTRMGTSKKLKVM